MTSLQTLVFCNNDDLPPPRVNNFYQTPVSGNQKLVSPLVFCNNDDLPLKSK